nr:septal ring lytic transglycosylase RlpA family protein [uncultured Flavobacterium sp.]
MLQDTLKIDSTQLNLTYRPYKKAVHASYYHDRFNGRKTASGKRFDNSKMTAAHKKLPFGTKLRVTNPANNKSVIVTVTDRGPFTRGREIDLTRKAFTEIAHAKGRGFLNVNIEIVKE